MDSTATDAEVDDLADTASELAEEVGGEVRLSDEDGGQIVSVAVPESQVDAVSGRAR